MELLNQLLFIYVTSIEIYDLNISTAILYNHESPRRPEEYLSRKVTHGSCQN